MGVRLLKNIYLITRYHLNIRYYLRLPISYKGKDICLQRDLVITTLINQVFKLRSLIVEKFDYVSPDMIH